MPPFHKILVPTDFSAHSAEALRTAIGLAKAMDAPLDILAVYQPMMMPLLPDGALLPFPVDVGADVASINDQLQALERDTKAAGVAVHTTLRQGAPFAEIIACAREGGFDLIVMGTHGRSGLKHALLGSVTEKVVRKAPCAVLTVRLPGHSFEHP